jgi:hypothetical protein
MEEDLDDLPAIDLWSLTPSRARLDVPDVAVMAQRATS